MKRFALGILALAVTAGCSEQPTAYPGTPTDGMSSALAAQQAGYVATPAGWYHPSCVHEIPDGARVSRGSSVTRRDGSSYQLPKCLYRAFRTRPHGARQNALPLPVNNGWIEYAHASLGSGNWFKWLSAFWTVPATPAGSYSSSQVFYTFPGLESDTFIIQPVLSYSASGWQMASWHCDDGDNCIHSSFTTAGAGDAIYGKVVASDCANGRCTWWIHTMDLTRETETILSVEDTADYRWVTGGALEVYGLSSCNQYAGSGVLFSNIYLVDRYDNIVFPTWTHVVQSGTSPDCGWSVTSDSTTVGLFYNEPPELSNAIANDSSSFYSAQPSGGYAPYVSSYWEWCGIDCDGGGGDLTAPASRGVRPNTIVHGWQFLSTDWTVYWNESQRWLRSTVTDSHDQQAVATYYVQ